MKKITLITAAFCMAIAVNAQNIPPFEYGFEQGETLNSWKSGSLVTELATPGHTGDSCLKVTVADVAGQDGWALQWVTEGVVVEQACYRYTIWTKSENLMGKDKESADKECQLNITAGNYKYQDRGSKYNVIQNLEWTKTTIMMDLTPIEQFGTFADTTTGTNWQEWLTEAGVKFAGRFPTHFAVVSGTYYIDDIKCIKSNLADAYTKDANTIVLDFGFKLEETDGINAAAFMVSINGGEATAATAASLDTSLTICTLTTGTAIKKDDKIVVTVPTPADAGVLYAGDGPSSNIAEGYIAALNEEVVNNITTGVNENAAAVEFNLFPNPATTYFEVGSAHQIANVSVYDLTGKLVVSSVNSRVDISSLNSGVYMVQVTDVAGRTASKKLLK